jgi:hypothetical protein
MTTRQHFASVCEDLGSPPLELSVFGRRKSTDEGLACWQLVKFMRTYVSNETDLPRVYNPGNQQAYP